MWSPQTKSLRLGHSPFVSPAGWYLCQFLDFKKNWVTSSVARQKFDTLKSSGQITRVPKPELRAFWGDLGWPTGALVAIICPICPEIVARNHKFTTGSVCSGHHSVVRPLWLAESSGVFLVNKKNPNNEARLCRPSVCTKKLGYLIFWRMNGWVSSYSFVFHHAKGKPMSS